jgi:hypothetical protein
MMHEPTASLERAELTSLKYDYMWASDASG